MVTLQTMNVVLPHLLLHPENVLHDRNPRPPLIDPSPPLLRLHPPRLHLVTAANALALPDLHRAFRHLSRTNLATKRRRKTSSAIYVVGFRRTHVSPTWSVTLELMGNPSGYAVLHRLGPGLPIASWFAVPFSLRKRDFAITIPNSWVAVNSCLVVGTPSRDTWGHTLVCQEPQRQRREIQKDEDQREEGEGVMYSSASKFKVILPSAYSHSRLTSSCLQNHIVSTLFVFGPKSPCPSLFDTTTYSHVLV
jgi:hypothetical protein